MAKRKAASKAASTTAVPLEFTARSVGLMMTSLRNMQGDVQIAQQELAAFAQLKGWTGKPTQSSEEPTKDS